MAVRRTRRRRVLRWLTAATALRVHRHDRHRRRNRDGDAETDCSHRTLLHFKTYFPLPTSHFPLLTSFVGDDVLAVALLARQVFDERRLRIRIQAARARRHDERFHQRVRILDLHLPRERVAVARQLLDDVHVVAVEPAGPVNPALVVEADDVDDHRVALPLADGIAVPGGVLRLDGIVRTAVDGDDAELVAARVEEDELGRRLDDLARRTHARHARRLAVELGVVLHAVAVVVLDLLPQLGLVHRDGIHPLLDARVALEVHARRAVAEIELLLRAGTLLEEHRQVALLVRLVAAATAATAPHA